MVNAHLGQTTKQRKALNNLVAVMMINQPFKKIAKLELECFDKRLNSLEAKVDGNTDAIDNLEFYSYQYNLKLVGIPELKAKESWLETSNLCFAV